MTNFIKFYKNKNLSLVLILILASLLGVLHTASAREEYDDWGYYQCSRHGWHEQNYCDYVYNYISGFPEAVSVNWQANGHRHGSSEIWTAVCLTNIFTGGADCQYFNCHGDQCGSEYGDEHPFNNLGWGVFGLSGLAEYRISRAAYVEDAEVQLAVQTTSQYPDPIYGCTDPNATNYDPEANTNDGSCVYGHFVNLNFYVKNQYNQAVSGAYIAIDQDFGNGTTRTADGSGFANFGVLNNKTIGYYVSANSCSGNSGSIWSNEGATANVTLNCIVGRYKCVNQGQCSWVDGDVGSNQCSQNSDCCVSNYGSSCTSAANACGQTSSGTISCNGSCSATTPALPPNYGTSCTSAANACGQTNTGTILCTGLCSATIPANPSGYGSSCTSSANACGQTSTGTILCDGTCSATPPPLSSCPATSVSISSSPTSVIWNGSSTITWSSQNATSCTASGDWSGSKSGSGSVSTGALTQVRTYTYTLSCTGLNGTDTKSATVAVAAPVPSVGPGNPTYSIPNYCASGPGGYVTWSYTDPANSPQTAYEIQITNIGNFNNPMYDSGKLNSSSRVFAIPNGILTWNTTYKARVRVWNSYDSVSAWSGDTGSWMTPSYAYPNVIPLYQFTWPTSPKPQQNKLLQFTDHTVFGGGNENNRQWSWTFGDGGTSTQQSPAHTYSTVGNYTVRETVTDAANQTCYYEQTINIQKPIPVIKEVAPK